MHCHVHHEYKCRLPIFWLLAVAISWCPATPPLDSAVHSWALTAIDYVYSENYKGAEETARKIIEKYPANPAGYFFMAVAIDSWMVAHLSNKKEDEFFRYCDLAVEKGDALLDKDPQDEWALFFIGGAEGYKGTYEARYGRWITAFRYGWKGVSILNGLKEKKCDLVDIDVGIGCYQYWRSALIKSLWWMPHVDDKRQEGIDLVLRARKFGTYTRVSASASLIDIFVNEEKYPQALTISNEGLQRYPHSHIFILGKARSLYGLGKYEESLGAYRQVLAAVEADPGENRAIIALCRFWIAKINFALERYAEVITECDLMKNSVLDDDSKKLLAKQFSEVDGIKKKAILARKTQVQGTMATQKPN